MCCRPVRYARSHLGVFVRGSVRRFLAKGGYSRVWHRGVQSSTSAGVPASSFGCRCCDLLQKEDGYFKHVFGDLSQWL
jgi:hypothetical protein